VAVNVPQVVEPSFSVVLLWGADAGGTMTVGCCNM
jgi:hypothetical protein